MTATFILLASIFVLVVILILLVQRGIQTRKNYFNDDRNCPICGDLYDSYQHKKLKYHISYNPEKWIYACQLCNQIEYLHRVGNLDKILKNIDDLKNDKNPYIHKNQ